MENEDIVKNDDKKKKSGGKRRFLFGFVVGLVVMGAVGFLGITLFEPLFYHTPLISETVLDKQTKAKIDLITDIIDSNYYEEVDRETLQNGLYRGLFQGLDEYSEYYTQEEAKANYESTVSGSYSGIGATLTQDQDTMVVSVQAITKGSPAEEAGLQVGDIIISADEYKAVDMTLTEFVTHVRGEEGTAVHLVIEHDGKEGEFDIERKHLELPAIEYAMLGDGVGYIAISDFTDATLGQFQNALYDLEDEDMTGLIIDLRGNLGGLVSSATDILDELLPKGLLVYTEDKDGKKTTYNSTDAKSVDVPMVVIVNQLSASASEIFAGAIQDRGAGTLVGTTTYGKGIVQTYLPLTDGSAVKLTTSRYFTPNGVCIQGVGLTPDVEVEYEFLADEGTEYSPELDSQVQKAMEVLGAEFELPIIER